MMQPGRSYSAGNQTYRYSINGQEKEMDLNENITTALYWEYDSRIGRRWNVDPIVKVWESPYSTFSNNPISYVDPNGLDSDRPDRGPNRRAKRYANEHGIERGNIKLYRKKWLRNRQKVFEKKVYS
jgi:RHS repeat-associated protein